MLRRTALSLLALLPFGAKAAVAPRDLKINGDRQPFDAQLPNKPVILSIASPDDDTREIVWEVDHAVGHYDVILEFGAKKTLIRSITAGPHQETLRCLLTGYLATGPTRFAIRAVSKSGMTSHTTSWPNGEINKAEDE